MHGATALLPCLAHHVVYVVLMGSEEEMERLHALRIVAAMADLFLGGQEHAVRFLVHYPRYFPASRRLKSPILDHGVSATERTHEAMYAFN
jgi:hypothetical protein